MSHYQSPAVALNVVTISLVPYAFGRRLSGLHATTLMIACAAESTAPWSGEFWSNTSERARDESGSAQRMQPRHRDVPWPSVMRGTA